MQLQIPMNSENFAPVFSITKEKQDLLLQYTLSATPSPITVSSEIFESKARIFTTIANSNQFYAKQLVFGIPIGSLATDLTEVVPVATVNTKKWHISPAKIVLGREYNFSKEDQQYAVFEAHCLSEEDFRIHYDLFFMFTTDQVNRQVGSFTIELKEESSQDGEDYQTRRGSFALTKSPWRFFADNFVASAPGETRPRLAFENSEALRVSWNSNGEFFRVFSNNTPEPIYEGEDTSFEIPDGLSTASSLVLEATITIGSERQFLYRNLNIVITNPDLSTNTLEVDTNANVKQRLFANQDVLIGTGEADTYGPLTIRGNKTYSGITLYKDDRKVYSAKIGQGANGEGFVNLIDAVGKTQISLDAANGSIKGSSIITEGNAKFGTTQTAGLTASSLSTGTINYSTQSGKSIFIREGQLNVEFNGSTALYLRTDGSGDYAASSFGTGNSNAINAKSASTSGNYPTIWSENTGSSNRTWCFYAKSKSGNYYGQERAKLDDVSEPRIMKGSDTDSALNIIEQLNVYRFAWTDSGVSGMDFLDDKLDEVFPEAVGIATDKETGESDEAISHTQFIPLLVQAIKEQQLVIGELKDKLDALVSRG